MAITTVLLTKTGSAVYNKPSTVRKIIVEGWGAGGSGSAVQGATFIQNHGYGGSGGNYAKKTIYYPRTQQNIPYVVCPRDGNLSASAWYDPTGTTGLMVATRGRNGPTKICSQSGQVVTCRDEFGNLFNNTNFLSYVTASTVGCVGDIIYKGGSGSFSPYGDNENGGFGGGGAGSTGDGDDASDIDFAGFPKSEFGGQGGNVQLQGNTDYGTGSIYGGGGGSFYSLGGVGNGGFGAQGLIRLTIYDNPLISKITWNGNDLLFGYELDNAVTYSTVIDGSQFVRIENGDEYSWVPNTNYILEGDVRWIPTTSTATQTGWDGATGWRAFLEYARAKNKFRFYIDSTEATYIESYLIEPLNGQHDLEIDGTRRIRLVIRNTTTPYTGF